MGRGGQSQVPNRFEQYSIEEDPEFVSSPQTEWILDHAKSILSKNDSPDLPYHVGLNPYRGCEHGCSYCFARPTHEYLGYSAGLDFESRIVYKKNAPELLKKELNASSWSPQTILLSGVTDGYQPVEKKLELTRKCLHVLADFRNPVVIITKNHLVTRDMDYLKELAKYQACAVLLSITTNSEDVRKKMEPRTSPISLRLKTLESLAKEGIPCGVLMAPVIPGLNDEEMPRILSKAKEHGAEYAGYVALRLPHGVKDIFGQWLHTYFPDKEKKVLHQIQEMSGGKLYQPEFGTRFSGVGVWAEQFAKLFAICCKKEGLSRTRWELSTDHFRRPGEQLSLF